MMCCMAAVDLILLRRRPFVTAVANALAQRCGVRPGDRLLVAVSGGSDSTALLLALAALAGAKHWQLGLHVAHIHHHLRDEADDDAAFVADLAARLGLTHHRREIHPASAGGNLEATARRLRYEALIDVADAVDADAIAVAHHADDQLETILMRLMRGASLRGLAGMAPARRLGRRRLIRPMLAIDPADGRAMLREIGQPWREDATNADLSRVRAALRHEVLPALRAIQPGAAAKAGETADRLREIDRYLARRVRTVERRLGLRDAAPGDWALDRAAARALPAELLRVLLRRALIRAAAQADRLPRRRIDEVVEAIRDADGSTRTFHFGKRSRVGLIVERDRIRLDASM